MQAGGCALLLYERKRHRDGLRPSDDNEGVDRAVFHVALDEDRLRPTIIATRDMHRRKRLGVVGDLRIRLADLVDLRFVVFPLLLQLDATRHDSCNKDKHCDEHQPNLPRCYRNPFHS